MPRVIVVGSANTDLTVKADRLPRSGETVFGDEFVVSYGGKGANQAVAAARAGGDDHPDDEYDADDVRLAHLHASARAVVASPRIRDPTGTRCHVLRSSGYGLKYLSGRLSRPISERRIVGSICTCLDNYDS